MHPGPKQAGGKVIKSPQNDLTPRTIVRNMIMLVRMRMSFVMHAVVSVFDVSWRWERCKTVVKRAGAEHNVSPLQTNTSIVYVGVLKPQPLSSANVLFTQQSFRLPVFYS